VRGELASTDVIHSFWIPQLAGKMDVIPGQTNVMWLQADRPGVYRGQCGEYCGAQHAHMALALVADPPEAYRAWIDGQLREAAAPASATAQRGHDAFVAHCGACHTVRGAGAGGILGPDLTHLMSRRTLAAGLLANTPGNLAAWIADSQALKPGSRMPRLALSGPELASVVAYLETLK
jgi:cytochrome c oxidase subunit 2